jgi:glycosyltransferase involved in cell wall biosynthesis
MPQGNKTDLVSILIRTYKDPTVGRAIESALAQKCNKEVIVYDDGSPTPYVDATDHRITYIRGKRNKGEHHAGNVLMRVSKGKYFIFLDSDDVFCSPYVVPMLLANVEDHDFVYGDLVLVKNGTIIGKWSYPNPIPQNFRQAIIERNGSGIIPFNVGLHRREFWRKNKIRYELCIGEDTLASVRFIEAGGKCKYLPYSIINYTYGAGTASCPARVTKIAELVRILQTT